MHRLENKILHLTAVVTFYQVLSFAIQQDAPACSPLTRSNDGPWTTLKMTWPYRDLDMTLTWCIGLRLLWPSIISSCRHVIHIYRHIDYLKTCFPIFDLMGKNDKVAVISGSNNTGIDLDCIIHVHHQIYSN